MSDHSCYLSTPYF